MKVLNLIQGSQEWLAHRQGCIGASEASAILGISKFSTPYQLYLEKKGIVQGFTGNVATQAGHEAEDKARAMYEMLHGEFETFTPIVVAHEKHTFMLASLDGYNHNLKRVLEIKYPSEESHNLALTGVVPAHYMAQMQYQLEVCDEATHGHYWSFRESNGAMIHVERNESFINETLLPAILCFKQLLDNSTPPLLTEKDAKWFDDEEMLSYFEEIKLAKDKEIKNKIASKIITISGHNRVKTKLGLVTDVMKNGIHNYYKFTAAK